MGQLDEAKSLLAQSLDINRQVLGETHPHVAVNLNNQAIVSFSSGSFNESSSLLCQALEILRKSVGDEHPLVAMVEFNLAFLYDTLGRSEEADALRERSSSD